MLQAGMTLMTHPKTGNVVRVPTLTVPNTRCASMSDLHPWNSEPGSVTTAYKVARLPSFKFKRKIQ